MFLNFLVTGCLLLIFYQDYKSREVYWFLFPFLGMLLSVLFFLNSHSYFVLLSMLFNSMLVSMIILILYLYTRFISKKNFLDHSFGLGDILFFYAFCLGFPSLTFIVLFTFSILFTTSLYFILKKDKKNKTVPLAGFMSLFLVFIFGISLIIEYPILYIH